MHHIPKIVAKSLIILLLFSGMAALAGVSWLKSKPRTIPGMDVSLNRVIKQQGWPFSVKFGKAHTHWDEWDSPLSLEVLDLSVADNEGGYSLNVPRATLRFRVLPLLHGQLRFRHVVLVEPTLEWKIEPATETEPPAPKPELSYAKQWKLMQKSPVYRASLKTLFGLLESPAKLPIQKLEALDVTINLALPEETRTIKRERVMVRLRDSGEGNELTFTSSERIRGVSAIFTVQVIKDTNEVIWAKANVENFSTDWIKTALPDLSWYGNLGLFFTGELNAFINRTGRLEQADFSLLSTARSSLQFVLSGNLKNMPIYEDYRNIPDVSLHAELLDVPVERIAAYWPLDIGVDARTWVTQSLTKGFVPSAVADIKLPPSFWTTGSLPVDGVKAVIPFERTDINIAPDLPPITGAKGKAEITRDRVYVLVDGGMLKSSTIEPGATAIIPDLGDPVMEHMHITGKATGPIADLLSFYSIQQEKLGKTAAFNTSKVKGKAVSDFSIRFPLLAELKISDVSYAVKADITEFNYADIVPNISLTNAKFTMDYKDDTLHVDGNGGLNGIDSKITYITSTKEKRKSDADITISNTINAEDLPKLGFPKVPGVTGPLTMSYRMEEQPDSRSIAIALDGKDATLFFPAFGLNKPAQEPLNVTLNLAAKGKEDATLKSFQIDGASLKAKGNSEFDQKGNLKELLIDSLIFGKNDTQLKISRAGEAYVVQVAAQTLNLEPLIRYYSTKKEDGSKDTTSFTIKGTSRTVLVMNDEKFTNVAGNLTCVPDKCISANLSAKTGDNKNLTVSLLPGEKENVFSINTENAGAVLRGLDIIKDVRGGMLSSRAVADAKKPDDPFTGNLTIKDFRVVGTPVLARLLTLISLNGVVDTLNGQGISFTRLDGRYTYGNHTYQLNTFKLYGSALGILVNGYVNLKDSLIKLSGTLIPAYGINNVIKQVPIVGSLLGKGVLATSFTVEGPLDNPKTEVYPLSTLAPGIIGDFARELGILPADKVKQPSATPPAPEPVVKGQTVKETTKPK
jgi:hypothetical protein